MNVNERRVVITGLGVIAPNGGDAETFWQSLLAGKSGVRTIECLDTSAYACKIAGEIVGFEPRAYFKDHKDARRADRYCQFAMAAAKMAVADSGLELPGEDPERIGVMVGSGIGGLQMLEEQHKNYLEKGAKTVSPFTIPMMISNIASGMISMEFQVTGPNMAIVTACATSNHNIGEAWRIIKFGDADAFIAGGSEAAISVMGMSGFGNMKALSTRNDSPQQASRPFDKDRDGFVMGEGAGVVVIEELEHAKKRGAHIYCELVGYGISADAYHLSAPLPEGEGASRSMNMALKHARLNPNEVQYVNAHGTSTPMGDLCETKAMKRTFGDWAYNGLAVSSTKSMTGHLLGAAGGVELIACLLALRDLDYVPHTARPMKLNAALSNGFGFGGHNSSVLIRQMA